MTKDEVICDAIAAAVSVTMTGDIEINTEQFNIVLRNEEFWVAPVEANPEMIKSGHFSDPLACDVPEGQIPLVYGAIYRAMRDACLNSAEKLNDKG